MGRNIRRCNSAAVVACASLLLVLPSRHSSLFSVDAASATSSDTLWEPSWGSKSSSSSSSSTASLSSSTSRQDAFDLGAIEELPSEKMKKNPPKAVSSSAKEDEPWREKSDWWKDPLAMFDEDDDEFVEKTEKQKASKTKETEQSTENSSYFPTSVTKNQHDKLDGAGGMAQEVTRLENEKQQKFAMEQAAREKLEQDRSSLEKAAQEKLEREKIALDVAAKELAAREKAALEKAVKQQEALEKAAKEMLARQQAAKEKAAKKQAAMEKAAQKKLEKEREANETLEELKGKGSGSALSASIFALSMPSFRASLSRVPFLASPASALGVIAALAIGNVVVGKMFRRNPQDEVPSAADAAMDEYKNEVLVEDTLQMQYQMDEFRYLEEETEDTSDDTGIDLDSDVDSSVSNSHSQHQQQRNEVNKYSPSNSSPTFMGGLRSALVGGHSRSDVGKFTFGGGRRVKVTADELEYLKSLADKAMIERQAMEKEYEKTSFQLQEAQSEVTQLASTTKYLKAQLKDYEEMMDRTIRNERKKAKVEIQRMKEVMEASIEQDRESLRRQFTKELERLQAQYEVERARREQENLDKETSNESVNDNISFEETVNDDTVDDESVTMKNETTTDNTTSTSTIVGDETSERESPVKAKKARSKKNISKKGK